MRWIVKAIAWLLGADDDEAGDTETTTSVRNDELKTIPKLCPSEHSFTLPRLDPETGELRLTTIQPWCSCRLAVRSVLEPLPPKVILSSAVAVQDDKIYYPKTSLSRCEMHDLITSVLPQKLEDRRWSLVYSGAEHGFSLRTLYKQCEPLLQGGFTDGGIGRERATSSSPLFTVLRNSFTSATSSVGGGKRTHPAELLLVIRTTDNEVFGAFITSVPRIEPRHIGTRKTFVFRRNRNGTSACARHGTWSKYGWFGTPSAKNGNENFVKCSSDGITIGYGRPAIVLNEDLQTGYCGHHCRTFNSPDLTSFTSPMITVEEAPTASKSHGSDLLAPVSNASLTSTCSTCGYVFVAGVPTDDSSRECSAQVSRRSSALGGMEMAPSFASMQSVAVTAVPLTDSVSNDTQIFTGWPGGKAVELAPRHNEPHASDDALGGPGAVVPGIKIDATAATPVIAVTETGTNAPQNTSVERTSAMTAAGETVRQEAMEPRPRSSCVFVPSGQCTSPVLAPPKCECRSRVEDHDTYFTIKAVEVWNLDGRDILPTAFKDVDEMTEEMELDLAAVDCGCGCGGSHGGYYCKRDVTDLGCKHRCGFS